MNPPLSETATTTTTSGSASSVTQDEGNQTTIRRMILKLPSTKHVLQSWKVSSGSPVRQGETVALLKEQSSVDNQASAGTSSTASAPSAAPPRHKRPTKRRRPVPKAGASSTNTSTTAVTATATSSATTSLPSSLLTFGRNDSNENNNSTTNDTTTTPKLSEPSSSTTTVSKEGTGKPAAGTTSSSSSTKPSTTIPVMAPMNGILHIASSTDVPLQIGYVQTCDHPTIIDGGLCVLCGLKVTKPSRSGSGQPGDGAKEQVEEGDADAVVSSGPQSTVTVAGGWTVRISESEGQRMAQQQVQRLHTARKLSLVLDLDHTLVHATHDARAQPHLQDRMDVRSLVLTVPCLVPGPTTTNSSNESQEGGGPVMLLTHYIKMRPYLFEFLDRVQPLYELGVYTAGTRQYAEQMTMLLARHYVLWSKTKEAQEGQQQQQQQQQKEAIDQTNNKDSDSDKASIIDSKDKKVTEVSPSPAMKYDTTDLERLHGELLHKNHLLEQWRHEYNAKQPKKTQEATPQETVKDEGISKETVWSDTGPPEESQEKNATSTTIASEGSASTSSVEQSRKRKDEGESEKQTSLDDTNEEPPKKRKRVSFGSTEVKEIDPSEGKVTLKDIEELEEHVRKLKQEWTDATKLEQEALEVRQRLFGGRIVSRTDTMGDLGRDAKSLHRMFPGTNGGDMAVIVDDREDVWANGLVAQRQQQLSSSSSSNAQDQGTHAGEPPDNLLLVKPYHWGPFSGFADVNNASGTDWSKQNAPSGTESASTSEQKQQHPSDNNKKVMAPTTVKEEDDEQLLWTADILHRIHKAYYEDHKNDVNQTVPAVVRKLRSEVLKGSDVLLSGLVPLHRQQPSTDGNTRIRRPRPQFIRYAETLGAKVSSQVHSDLTHVIAAKEGTEKVLAARQQAPNCSIVKASWIMECVWSFTLRNVETHLWPLLLSTSRINDESKRRSQHLNHLKPLIENLTEPKPLKPIPPVQDNDATNAVDKVTTSITFEAGTGDETKDVANEFNVDSDIIYGLEREENEEDGENYDDDDDDDDDDLAAEFEREMWDG